MTTIIGTLNNDSLIGTGNDLLLGLAGFDTLIGGTLIGDTLEGGDDGDLYVVSSADTIIEISSGGTDTVLTFLAAYTLPDHVETLKLGADFGAVATGNTLDNIISGNNGSDTLDGAVGADIMAGGLGDDLYVVDHLNDQVMELANSGTDEIQSSVDYNMMQAWHVENLTLIGAAVVGNGNWLNNVINGNMNSNVIFGDRGNDTIFAGVEDTIDGGADLDMLVLDTTPIDDLVGITNIELIDMTGSTNNALTVSYDDVLNVNMLTINGNVGDSVLLDSGWVDSGVTGEYHAYTHDVATLLVDTDIAVIM